MEKNGVFIGYAMAEAWEAGYKSNTLVSLCEEIIKSGKKSRASKAKGIGTQESATNPASA
jgi:hypothetical protein